MVNAIIQIFLNLLSISWFIVSYQHRHNTAACAASLCVGFSALILSELRRKR